VFEFEFEKCMNEQGYALTPTGTSLDAKRTTAWVESAWVVRLA
jgi:hypothetical protein